MSDSEQVALYILDAILLAYMLYYWIEELT